LALEEVKIVVNAEEESYLPTYGSLFAAGADIRACIEEDICIESGESALVPSGIRMEIPEGFEIQVRPRSGLALKHQVTVLNTPGTIDSDYRGEVGVILINHGKSSFRVTKGMRIAQVVLARALKAAFVVEKKELSLTARGEGGFGHTGVH
jgi:dUTP pyrophosphatase